MTAGLRRTGFPRRREQRTSRRTWILPLLVVAVAWAAYGWYSWALRPVAADSEVRETVTIESGSSTAEVADLLAERGLVRSAFAFRLFVQFSGREGAVQAGTFVLRPAMSAEELLSALALGKAEEEILTIPEGLTVAELDALVAGKGLLPAGAILECAKTCDVSGFTFLPSETPEGGHGGRLEGYLFPDTYYVVAADLTAQSLVERLLRTFQSKVVDGLASKLKDSGRSLADVTAMASLLETEARGPEERRVVAGILWKRLDEGISLGVDAAVRYAVQKDTEPLTAADLASDSPYNLRALRGLPPGPIANPGLDSVAAALEPEASPYYFYLHDDDGQIHYARTLDEHNANKSSYLH